MVTATGGQRDASATTPHAAGAELRLAKVGAFASPDYVASAPGVRKTLYVVQRAGKVIAYRAGKKHTFINVTKRTTTNGERGLLSIAFDPNYQRNHFVYTFSTNNRGDPEVDRFRAASDLHVRSRSRRTVIVIPHPDVPYHNGGTIRFGPDGFLYVGTGDGTDDPAAGHTDNLLGKLLRIDPHPKDGSPYTIPASNPYVAKPGMDEIYAIGLRNPFRFTFDGPTRHLLLADVGSNSWEEVDFESPKRLRGADFGWPYYEGAHRTNLGFPKPTDRYRPPIFDYPHTRGRCAIVGGTAVHDHTLNALRGRFVYADLCTGKLRSLVPHRKRATGDRPLGLTVPDPAGLVTANGHVYVASLDGPVYRLAPKR